MTPASPHGIYGLIPPALVDTPADAQQLSPLIPGAAALDGLAPASLARITVHAPPGTRERRYVLAHALTALTIGAPLTALAAKDAGGNRIAGELRALGCEVTEESRRHHRICTTIRPATLQGVEAALAEGGPQQHPAHGLWTQPGIFSWDRIDAGSALLLKHLPRFSGHGADIGCGFGVLARAVLHIAQVTSLVLVDSDCRAINAATRNIHDARAQFLWADIRHAPLTPDTLDFVVMNPPFHEHGIENRALGQQCIAQAAALLKRGGQCWLTANSHLPYEAPLAALFRQVRRVAEADGFKIYAAEK